MPIIYMFFELESQLGYTFTRKEWLQEALTHKSSLLVGDQSHYQRLEFVGDAILGLFVAESLFKSYPEADEGLLTQWRASLVNRDFLCALARHHSIQHHIIVSSDQKKVKNNESVLADVMEAIIAAIFFDTGWEGTCKVLHQWLDTHIEHVRHNSQLKDPKTTLQEYLQARKWPLPEYVLILQTGPQHRPNFVVQLNLPSFHSRRESYMYSTFGEGVNRKEADRQAAAKVMRYLQSVDLEFGEQSA